MDGFGELRFCARIIVWAVIDLVVFQEFNIREIGPPGMDTSGKTKYPVLFGMYEVTFFPTECSSALRRYYAYDVFFSFYYSRQVWSADESKMVTNRYQREWEYHIVSRMRYVGVAVDGHGSNYKGRKFRNPVRGRLGDLESLDQVSAAR